MLGLCVCEGRLSGLLLTVLLSLFESCFDNPLKMQETFLTQQAAKGIALVH